MRVKFWGTRGSLPCSKNNAQFVDILESLIQKASGQGISTTSEFLKGVKSRQIDDPVLFGGETTCLEVEHDGCSLYVDMGSGLRNAGTDAMKRGCKEFKIFLTHMHWDHVMGLPFFVPIHVPGSRIEIYHVHENAPEHVKILFNGINFPVAWDVLPSTITFHKLEKHKPVDIDGIEVTPFMLDHPGECFGYHFRAGGRRLTFGVDGEYKRFTPKELGDDQKFYNGTDMLIYDGQYAMSELAARFDWGHSSPNLGVDLAIREMVKSVVFTHHDPWSDSEKLCAMLYGARAYLESEIKNHQSTWKSIKPEGPDLQMAYDGLDINL